MKSYKDSIQTSNSHLHNYRSYYDTKQKTSTKFSISNHSVSNDYDKLEGKYSKKIDGIYWNKSQSSSSSMNESSSSGIDSLDENSLEAHSSSSESLIIQSHHSSISSTSSCFRKVIIKSSQDDKIAVSNRQRQPRRRRRDRGRKRFRRQPNKQILYEKQLMYKNQPLLFTSQCDNHHRSLPKECESEEQKLKRLYDDYTNENIHIEWQPLSFAESRQLYQFVLDKHSQ